jgi:hypothetical protein
VLPTGQSAQVQPSDFPPFAVPFDEEEDAVFVMSQTFYTLRTQLHSGIA